MPHALQRNGMPVGGDGPGLQQNDQSALHMWSYLGLRRQASLYLPGLQLQLCKTELAS